MTTERLSVLQNSLIKKNAKLAEKFNTHFSTVAESNGQPLNDKRNGRATLNKWERQSDGIRTQLAEIEKTKLAIDKELRKISAVDALELPDCIKSLLADGTITQWRKFPNRFFVAGVDGARIVYEDNTVKYSHLEKIKPDQYAKFRDVFNLLRKSLTA